MFTIILGSCEYASYCMFNQALLGSRRTNFKLEVFRLSRWVKVTHETKNAVMQRISKDDLHAVGCQNPDIFVQSKKDDRIVLTPPRTFRNENGKSKKHITDIKASEIFGDEWPERLNVIKLQTLGNFYEEVKEGHEHLHELLEDKYASVAIVRVSSTTLLAFVCR